MKEEQTIAQFLNVKDFPFEIKDKNGKVVYQENSDGFWSKWEYDDQGNQIRSEDSDGYIVDRRPKPMIELTLEDIAKLKGVSVSQIRIKE
jgi:YD repeat-containing protein